MKFTTTKAKTIIIVLASLLLFCAIAAVLPVMADAGTPKYIWTGETVADKYSYGQTFAVPERRLDGVQTDVSHTLVFPDGHFVLCRRSYVKTQRQVQTYLHGKRRRQGVQ